MGRKIKRYLCPMCEELLETLEAIEFGTRQRNAGGPITLGNSAYKTRKQIGEMARAAIAKAKRKPTGARRYEP